MATTVTELAKKLAAEKAASEKKEEETAKDKRIASGMVLVRLRRPFFSPEGKYYKPGIHEMPKAGLPSSAVVIKE